jgi:Rrf2 family nitric oxide-sensitive transcriptional repressor
MYFICNFRVYSGPMQLTQFTDYALRVLVYAAVPRDGRCLTGDVAAAFGISRHHVVKVVNELSHLGYLETTRGRRGGFALARPAGEVRIGEVVRRAEGTIAIVECFDPARNRCPLAPACGLKDTLGSALAAFLAVLDGCTLADLVAEPRWRARVTRVSRRRPSRRPAPGWRRRAPTAR